MGTTVNYGTASSYVNVASGSATLGVEAAGTTSLLINKSITLSSSIYYTVLAGNYSSSINATILTADNTTPTSGNVSSQHRECLAGAWNCRCVCARTRKQLE